MNAVADFFFSYLVFPGLVFAGLVALLYMGIDRKVTAHMQHRIGPPIWQEFLDFGKLMGKEDITPSPAQSAVFSAAPLVALGAIVAVMLLLPVSSAQPALRMVGDLIVIIYLLNIPAVCMMLGGYASACPFGVVGAGRYVVQLFAYELVFILAIISVVVRVGSLSLPEIVEHQAANGWLCFDWCLLPAVVAVLIAAQGKLLRVPFDIPEAHTEIVHGALTEYSGPKLAIWRAAWDIEALAVAGLIVALFFGGPAGWFGVPAVVGFLIKTLLLVILWTTIRNIMARFRIDQALRFFWTWGLLLAAVSVVLVVVP